MIQLPKTPSILLILALGLAAASSLAGAEPGWIPIGPDEGQEVRSLAALPGSPGRLAVAGYSGVFRTDDGSRWELLNVQGVPFGESGTLDAPAVPGGSLFFAVGPSEVILQPEDDPFPQPEAWKLFESSDAGTTWRVVNKSSGPLAVSDLDPKRLYLATVHGIETSRDGGETWTPVAPEPLESLKGSAFLEIPDLEMAPSDPDTVYILLKLAEDHGFPDDVVLLRSRDGAATWELVEGPQFQPPIGVRRVAVDDLAIDPLDPDTLYLALSEGVFRSTNGGATWESRSDGLPFYRTNSDRETVYTVDSLLVDREEPALLYAAIRHSERSPGGVYRSADGGASWSPANTGLQLPTSVNDLAFDPDDSRVLYAATSSGVFRSADRGDSWATTPGRLPTPVRSVAVDPASPAKLFTGTYDSRLFTTEEGGRPWRRTARELPISSNVTLLSIAPTDPSLVFVHSLAGVSLGRSTDGGATWTNLRGPSLGDITEVLVDPRDSDRVFTSVGRLGGVFVSADQGTTWSKVLGGRIEALVQAPSNPDVLYAGALSGDFSPDPGVCRSGDGGGSWQCTAVGFSAVLAIPSLAVDPRDSSRVLAGLLIQGPNRRPAETLLVETLDGGATWEPVNPGLPVEGIGRLTDLLFDPRDPEVVWAATGNGGVFRSGDGGRSWTPVNRGLTNLGVWNLDLDPSGRVLVAATGNGLFRFSTSAGPPPPPEVDWIEDEALPGFRIKARIDQGGGTTLAAAKEPVCIPETVCLSGALPGRSELFVRIVGPKKNGFLWPTLVKFSTSRIEIWIQQLSTGELRYYELRGASPGVDELPGLFDRFGFSPE